MPDNSPPLWFPVLTLVIGYGLKSISELVQHRRAASRERDARVAQSQIQLAERRSDFQRETLLNLQEACMQLARATGAAQHQDAVAYRATRQWQIQLLSNELDESCRAAQGRTGLLAVRVRDNEVRELVASLKQCAAAITLAMSWEDSNRDMQAMVSTQERLNQRIGELLRRLDDEETE
jgi:hypothetical protein